MPDSKSLSSLHPCSAYTCIPESATPPQGGALPRLFQGSQMDDGVDWGLGGEQKERGKPQKIPRSTFLEAKVGSKKAPVPFISKRKGTF